MVSFLLVHKSFCSTIVVIRSPWQASLARSNIPFTGKMWPGVRVTDSPAAVVNVINRARANGSECVKAMTDEYSPLPASTRSPITSSEIFTASPLSSCTVAAFGKHVLVPSTLSLPFSPSPIWLAGLLEEVMLDGAGGAPPCDTVGVGVGVDEDDINDPGVTVVAIV